VKVRMLGRAAVAVVIIVALIAGFTPGLAHAAVIVAAPPDLNTVINNIRNWLVGLLVALATLLLTVGGVRYLLAGGDPGEVQKAKHTLKYAAVGYGVAVLAPLLVTILKSFVGG
jgi:Type IV secretion system pilin